MTKNKNLVLLLSILRWNEYEAAIKEKFIEIKEI
jgi:hypothetical protein